LFFFSLSLNVFNIDLQCNLGFLSTTVLQGSVATRVNYGKIFNDLFIANLLMSMMVKEFWRSVRIRQSYGKKSSGTFFSGHGVFNEMSMSLDVICFFFTKKLINFIVTKIVKILQPSKLSDTQSAAHLLARWEHYSPVVTYTSRLSICYAYNRHPLQAQAPFNLSVMVSLVCHSFERTQANPLCLSENLIS